MLTPRLAGARVLDLFAGSGSLGIEAASLGAAHVEWVERHGQTLSLLKQNVLALAPAGVTVTSRFHRSEVFPFLNAQPATPFDVILVDPPYADLEQEGVPEKLFGRLREKGWLQPDGLLVLESESRWKAPENPEGWQLGRRKVYGSSAITQWSLI